MFAEGGKHADQMRELRRNLKQQYQTITKSVVNLKWLSYCPVSLNSILWKTTREELYKWVGSNFSKSLDFLFFYFFLIYWDM